MISSSSFFGGCKAEGADNDSGGRADVEEDADVDDAEVEEVAVVAAFEEAVVDFVDLDVLAFLAGGGADGSPSRADVDIRLSFLLRGRLTGAVGVGSGVMVCENTGTCDRSSDSSNICME